MFNSVQYNQGFRQRAFPLASCRSFIRLPPRSQPLVRRAPACAPKRLGRFSPEKLLRWQWHCGNKMGSFRKCGQTRDAPFRSFVLHQNQPESTGRVSGNCHQLVKINHVRSGAFAAVSHHLRSQMRQSDLDPCLQRWSARYSFSGVLQKKTQSPWPPRHHPHAAGICHLAMRTLLHSPPTIVLRFRGHAHRLAAATQRLLSQDTANAGVHRITLATRAHRPQCHGRLVGGAPTGYSKTGEDETAGEPCRRECVQNPGL